jgi:excisionase family DNA binding protein
MANVNASDWLTLSEASKYLGVAPATTRKWSDQGRLPVFYTPGGHRRFQRAMLEQFIGGSQQPKAVRGRPLILVVEDDLVLRTSLRERLMEQGYDVLAIGGTNASVDSLRDLAPKLVLLDVGSLESGDLQPLLRIQGQLGPVPMIMFNSRRTGSPVASTDSVRGLDDGEFDLDGLLEQATQTVPLDS